MSESYQPGSVVGIQRTVQDRFGALTDADSLPIATLVRNGDNTGESITVTNISTGVYKLAFTIPVAWTLKDTVEVRVVAIVGGVTGAAIVWSVVLATPAVIGPLAVSQDESFLTPSPITLTTFRKSTKTFPITVLDTSGATVNLSGMELKFVVETNILVPIEQFNVVEPAITVTGGNSEIANVPTSIADTTLASDEYRWRLWDLNIDSIIAHGPFVVVQTSA